ncbi:MAG: hypothetical protein WC878_05895 [Candidatus Paceibacterota bacterium]|jgi:hypothetical protein
MYEEERKLPRLSDAINFSLSVQGYLHENEKGMTDMPELKEAIVTILREYPDCKVTDILTFADGSTAMLTREGFVVKDQS